jgi:peptidoglycan/xylan/chitin deacetylase (PgdA/CDA1 family)
MIRSLLILSLVSLSCLVSAQQVVDSQGAIIRSDTSVKTIYLLFSGHDFDEGFDHVLEVLNAQNVSASFFLTGDFVRSHSELVKSIHDAGHFVGAHSDKHLLYCDWTKRDSLLVSPEAIKKDIQDNLSALKELKIFPKIFLPPYEWYNQEVVMLAKELDQITINFSPGTRSNADFTTPSMKNYISGDEILKSIFSFEKTNGLNGFHLLIHPGTSPERIDKLYHHLDILITELKSKGYQFGRF